MNDWRKSIRNPITKRLLELKQEEKEIERQPVEDAAARSRGVVDHSMREDIEKQLMQIEQEEKENEMQRKGGNDN